MRQCNPTKVHVAIHIVLECPVFFRFFFEQFFANSDMAVDYFKNPPLGLDLSESRTASNNAIGIVLFILSFIFVALRIFVRLRLKHEPLGLDDYLMCVGLVFNAGNLACCIAGGFFGLGKHIWSLDPYQMRQITIVGRSLLLCRLRAKMNRSHSRTFSSTPGVCASSNSPSSRCIDASLASRGSDIAVSVSPPAIL
jgi:hypothetical protein